MAYGMIAVCVERVLSRWFSDCAAIYWNITRIIICKYTGILYELLSARVLEYNMNYLQVYWNII
jgi:hypothetical protein